MTKSNHLDCQRSCAVGDTITVCTSFNGTISRKCTDYRNSYAVIEMRPLPGALGRPPGKYPIVWPPTYGGPCNLLDAYLVKIKKVQRKWEPMAESIG